MVIIILMIYESRVADLDYLENKRINYIWICDK